MEDNYFIHQRKTYLDSKDLQYQTHTQTRTRTRAHTHVAEARQAALSLTHLRLDVSSITESYQRGIVNGQLISGGPTKYSLGSIRNILNIEGFSPLVQS